MVCDLLIIVDKRYVIGASLRDLILGASLVPVLRSNEFEVKLLLLRSTTTIQHLTESTTALLAATGSWPILIFLQLHPPLLQVMCGVLVGLVSPRVKLSCLILSRHADFL